MYIIDKFCSIEIDQDKLILQLQLIKNYTALHKVLEI